MDDRHRFGLASIVLAALAGFVGVDGLATVSPAAQQAPAFRGGVDLVNIGVTVTDRKAGLVTDLRAEDFEVFEDGTRQTIRNFAAGDTSIAGGANPDLHLGLMLDVSGSMGEDLKFSKSAAIKFLNTLVDAVDVTVIDFDTEVRASRYSQREFVRLIERIRDRKASGFTALYDAIGVYLDGASQQSGRKILLLYTDGGDTRSSLTRSDLLKLVKASDVTIYAIGELEHQVNSWGTEARMLLGQIADASGGSAFYPLSVDQLDELYAKIVAEIRAQYTIGYVSTNGRMDGSWRNVEIRAAPRAGGREGRNERRDYRIRSRKGYYAPYAPPAEPPNAKQPKL